MQEWLKELLGEAYTPQLEESLTAALAQRFVNREELDARQARWKTELETARAQAADWSSRPSRPANRRRSRWRRPALTRR